MPDVDEPREVGPDSIVSCSGARDLRTRRGRGDIGTPPLRPRERAGAFVGWRDRAGKGVEWTRS